MKKSNPKKQSSKKVLQKNKTSVHASTSKATNPSQNVKKTLPARTVSAHSTSTANARTSSQNVKKPSVAPHKYNVRTGTTDFGRNYETEIAALLALKCCGKSTRSMWLCMNLGESEDFDDVVLHREAEDGKAFMYMIQLKFNMKSDNITLGDLRMDKGDFSLKKYLKSIYNVDQTIRNQISTNKTSQIVDYFRHHQNDIIFVIYTNRILIDQSLCENVKTANWLHDVLLTGGSIFKFDYNKFDLSIESTIEMYTSNLFLLTEQIHIKNLEAAIIQELGNLIQPLLVPTSRLRDMVKNFLLIITNWSKGLIGGHYPITQDHVWKILLEQIFEPYMIKLEKVESNENFEDKLWKQITEDKEVTIIETDDTVCRILNQYIQNEIKKKYEDYRSLRDGKRDNCDGNEMMIMRETFQIITAEPTELEPEIYAFLWKTRQLPLLLKINDSEELKIILKKIGKCKGLFRVIILTEGIFEFSRSLSFKTFTTIEDLSLDHQTEILQKWTKLQGRMLIKLQNVITPDMYRHLAVNEIIKILCGNFIIGNSPADLPDTFINRSLEKVWLKNNVLQETSENVYLIKCNPLNDFELFVRENALEVEEYKIYKWSDFEGEFDLLSNMNIIIIENEHSLEKIIKFDFLKTKNVHYLSLHAARNLEWIKSFGSTKSIRKFRENSNSCGVISQIINENIPLPKLITGCPGMGKSLLVDYIVSCASINMWILKINLPEHSHYYNTLKTENSSPAISHLLYFQNKMFSQQGINNNNIAGEVFKRYLDRKNVFVVLDAFDEVPTCDQDNAKEIIKSIRDAGFSVCITTRTFLKAELEELLDTFSVEIKPFSKSDQIAYLIKHFSKDVKKHENIENLSVFVHKLIETVKTSLNNQDLGFTGVPLLMKLLAEVFESDCLHFLNSGHFSGVDFDLLYLYKHFIDAKMKIAGEKFGSVTVDILEEYKSHRSYCALQLLFSEDDLKPLNTKKEMKVCPKTLQILQKDGILVPQSDGHFTFIHPSFAEYLVSQWLFDNINTEHRKIVQNLFKKTFEPSLRFVRNMFDQMLAADCPLHLTTINLNIDKMKEVMVSNPSALYKNDKAGRSVLHLIASWGVYHPIKIKTDEISSLIKMAKEDKALQMLTLLPSDSIKNNKDSMLEFTPLDYAIFSSSLHIADALCMRLEYLNQHISISDFDTGYMLFYLNELNYASLASILIRYSVLKESNDFIQRVKSHSGEEDNLHDAIRNRNYNEVTSLISCGHDINKTDENGCTPIHIATILEDMHLVNLFVENDANLNIKDITGKTPLHWATIRHHNNIIRSLITHSADVSVTDNMGMTSLHYSIIANMNDHDDILYTFIETPYFHSAILIPDVHGKTALHYALHFNQTKNLELLLKYRANINIDITEQREFIDITKERQHSDVVKLLSCTDLAGATVLHWAAGRGLVDMVNIFLDYGSDIDQCDNYNRTALLRAVQNGHLEVVKLLITRGSNLHTKDDGGRTALIYASAEGYIDIVHFLLSKQAALETRAKDGKNALMYASQGGHIKVVQLLLENAADFETLDNDGRSALMHASQGGYTDIVHIFLNKRAAVKTTE